MASNQIEGPFLPVIPDAIRARLIDRIDRALDVRERAVCAALRREESWYHLRQLYPPPEDLEGRM